MVAKYEHLMLPGAFPDKVTLDTDFTDEAVVHCDVPFVKILSKYLMYCLYIQFYV